MEESIKTMPLSILSWEFVDSPPGIACLNIVIDNDYYVAKILTNNSIFDRVSMYVVNRISIGSRYEFILRFADGRIETIIYDLDHNHI